MVLTLPQTGDNHLQAIRMGELGQLFSRDTQAIFYNWKEKPVQRMLDFDFLCGAYAPTSPSSYLGSSLTLDMVPRQAARRPQWPASCSQAPMEASKRSSLGTRRLPSPCMAGGDQQQQGLITRQPMWLPATAFLLAVLACGCCPGRGQ